MVEIVEMIERIGIVIPKEMQPAFLKTQASTVNKTMDNFRRGLHSYLGAGAKTGLGVCLSELKH